MGPAPPKPISAKSRGSMPRWMVTMRMAATMLLLTMSWIARAASTVVSPSGTRDVLVDRRGRELG